MKQDKKSVSDMLRYKAEEFLRNKPSASTSTLSEDGMVKLIHELEVHQVELEMQNEELMEARSAARDIAEKYANLYEFAPAGYFTISVNGRIVEINLSGTQMLGKTRSQLQNSLFGFHVSTDTRSIFNQFLKRVFKHNEKESCGVTLEADGNMPVYAHLTGVSVENGEHCLLTAVDITERKLAEDKAKQLAAIVQSSEDAIIGKTLDGIITSWNKGAEKIYGYAESEMIGNTISLLALSENDDEIPAILDRIKSGQVIQHYETLRRRKDGSEIQVSLTISPILDSDGKITAASTIARDITMRKLAEQQLVVAKEKAEESDKLKSAFLANMSHEIRTPMNGILGFAGLLKEPDLTGEEQQNYIRIIEKSGARMLNIINNIVDISKIEAEQMEVDLSDVNVNSVTEYLYAFFKPEAEIKGIRLILKNSLPSNECVINTDSNKFDSILSNLIKNAIKYTHSGSIEFGYTLPHESLLQFFVKDTGIGIPGDRQAAIFERFIQADISDKQAYQGAGLGLAIAKAYVEMLGGKIRVESEHGKGSIFYFTIPYNADKQANGAITKAVISEQKNVPVKNLKILIADDDETSDIFIELLINQFSREVLHAETGIEALRLFMNTPDIDLVLMDMKMPEMDGFEATRQIRGFNKDVIIIAQTAYGLSGDREKALDAGCNDYIAKPIIREELFALIQKYFKG